MPEQAKIIFNVTVPEDYTETGAMEIVTNVPVERMAQFAMSLAAYLMQSENTVKGYEPAPKLTIQEVMHGPQV